MQALNARLLITFTPLIFSAIFFAVNGENHISYIDSLFTCISAISVCGLAPIDLSSLTGLQQALLAVLACVGNPITVSWVMVYIRRHYLAKKCEHIIEAELEKRRAIVENGANTDYKSTWGKRLTRAFTLNAQSSRVEERGSDGQGEGEADEKKRARISNKKALHKLSPDMIRRMDDAPKPVDPNGWVTERPAVRRVLSQINEKENGTVVEKATGGATPSPQPITPADSSTNNTPTGPPTNTILGRAPTLQNGNSRGGVPLGHTLTVEFRTPERDYRRQSSYVDGAHSMRSRRLSTSADVVHDDRDFNPRGGVPLTRRNTTMRTYRSQSTRPQPNTMNEGYGGFPYPQVLLLRLIKKYFPSLERRFVRTLTIPRTQTLSNALGTLTDGDRVKNVNYVSFNAIVGRNSTFHMLTEEHLQELGGVEYRALTALLWIVGGYFLIFQLLAFAIIAPYMSLPRWRSDFEPPNLHRSIPSTWFSAFQTMSAFTNMGLSLVDQSMIPFQKAYPMIFVMVILVIAGNTGFPVFLRLTIWTITKIIPYDSRLNETLHFLLDHPRRCFIYLFPSHQTWFLLTVLIALNVTDWFFFLVLDIGSSTFEAIPVGVRFAIGLLQATCVRAAGFATVSPSALAPSVQALYVMMMYISVYPIAMSVRSTNVYEEKSLGVFEDDDEDSDSESEPTGEGPRVVVWGRFLAWHARRQLAFDMWWLGLGMFIVCIVERSKIQNESNLQWFTIFSIIFEIISAYSTVGLSLGVPFANFSFSGALTPLSKLIICAVMLRGRHRGLPVAIDRAVMLPNEFKKTMGIHETENGIEPFNDEAENGRVLFSEPENIEISSRTAPTDRGSLGE
ncbi:hypothetical protein EW145_g4017 [Phellinidium pouzarii]|uniref:Potassium transport protein n=1 Tax=Phellinidium pouzarii TaxID=167371 RepID=A0A4S4L505_9AGAM|nr:hypothetical protein EW145_g4017 [Phellinidium pouzarii]